MSRIGNTSITLTNTVTVSQDGESVVVKGTKGEIRLSLPVGLSIVLEKDLVRIERKNEEKSTRSLHGFFRATVANAVVGVDKGWTKILELSGVGFRANMSQESIVLYLGFSHPITVSPPPGITFSVREGAIVVSGMNKQAVGAIAAKIHALKKPEPYKGKGIKYQGEYIRKKAGKAKAVSGSAGAGAK